MLRASIHQQVVLGMNRKHALGKICAHSWKWFDLSNGKWMAYEAENNKTIDEAFWAGEPSVRINNRRRKYTIWFGNMMQVSLKLSNSKPRTHFTFYLS